MKKMILSTLIVLALFVSTKVNAMSESELLEKVKSSYTINGSSVKVDSSYITMAERYLDENEISATDCDFIASKIDDLVSIAKEEKTIDVAKLSAEAKEEIKKIAEDITSSTAVKVTIDKENGLTLYNTDNSVFSTIEKTPMKYTDSTLIIAASSLVLAVGGFTLFKRIKEND